MGMNVRATGIQVTIPAGTYFLGDPCYAVPDEQWMPLLESCGYFGAVEGPSGPVGTMEIRGEVIEVLAFGTAYGDGTYADQFGRTYDVDAGLIGLTPALPSPGWRYANNELEELGQIVTFDRDVVASTDGEGRLVFGHYRIDTTEDDEDGWS